MIKKIIFLTILLLLISSYFLPIAHIQAAEEPGYKIEVSVPGGAKKGTPVTLTQYVRYIYLVGLSAIGIAALGVLVYAGFMYMMAGTVTSKDEAKKRIWGALSGLVLALAAFLILYTINPDLVSLKAPVLLILPTTSSLEETEGPLCTSSNCPSSCQGACADEDWNSYFCKCFDF